jgi:nitrate/TMAO reductase-like tetraheme cytochrome c subunit
LFFSLSPLAATSLGCAGVSACILVGYLVVRPAWTLATKVALLLGLGVFPIAAAASGNVEGFEATKKRSFCGSCHVMELHRADSEDRLSESLSSRHARNALFGRENCYTCHADYGMFGTVLTKLGGMRHVWLYYTEYRKTPIAEAKETIKLRKPFPNSNCMQCHSTETKIWLEVPDHRAMLDDLRSDRVSCASVGCHGYAHPNFRPSVTPLALRSDASEGLP